MGRMRAQVAAASDRWRVWTRTGRDASASFPELAALPALVAGRPVGLDGELVALDTAAAPCFARLQRRMSVRRPGPHLLRDVPVILYAFDVLHLDGQATRALPYEQRRELLEALNLNADIVATPPAFVDAGAEVFAVATERGLEGVVAKRLGSRYEPGRRSRAWVKTPVPHTSTAVVCGWQPGAGRRHGMIGAVILGAHDRAGRLRHIGQVGTGFTVAALQDLRQRFAPLQRPSSPIPALRHADAVWLQPDLVCRVAFRAWTPDGQLRHPSWRGLVDDVPAEQVQLPTELDQ